MVVGEQYRVLHQAEDLALYESLERILREIGDVALGAIVGPSESGKDSIIDWLVANFPERFAVVVGDTNRPKRPGEINGKQHHFRKDSAMIRDLHRGQFVQVAPGHTPGIFYATRPQQYSKGKINLKTIYAREVPNFRRLGFKRVDWLQIVPYSFEAWLAWQEGHAISPEDQQERDLEVIESNSLALTTPGTHFILNDDIDKAGERIVRFAQGRRIPDETRAKEMAIRIINLQRKRLRQNT